MGFYCRGCAGLFEETKRLQALLDNPWINVTERLPKVGVAVFVWVPGSLYPRVGFRQRKTKYQDAWKVGGLNERNVTYWMLIPESPKIEGR